MTADDFRSGLAGLFEAAATAGRGTILVRSGGLHRAVGGYSGPDHRMPVCCNAMYAEMVEGVDEVLSAPPSGLGATVTIDYRLPRPGRVERAKTG